MKLHPVSVDILYDGMLVDFDIYYYHKGEPVLLCKDTVLTADMIRSIKSAMKFSKNIYMLKENHDRILRETAYFEMAQRRIEQAVGYDIIKDIARDFISTAHRSGMVSHKALDNLSDEIQSKLTSFDSAMIMQCLNGIRGTDEYLYVHSLNVGFLNGMVAGWHGFDEDYSMKLVKAGVVHDLGKLKISPEILNKPARLTPLEYESVKRHPGFGYEILKNSGESDETILDAVLHHHERINGTGYPDRLSNDSISMGARITAISDVYDAMIAERPYKGSSTPFMILQELVDTSFSGLDAKYVKILLDNMTRELQGSLVLLSNGAVAKVEFIDPRQPQYPIVSIEGEMLRTNENIRCVRIYPG